MINYDTQCWRNFKGEKWKNKICVSDFIQQNYTEYTGTEEFLAPPTEKTKRIWKKCLNLFKRENEKGILDVETTRISGINTLKPGYICEDDDVVVGLQADKPLKRLVNPYGGIRMVQKSLGCYQRKLNTTMEKHFTEYRKTHNDGVFDAYTPAIRRARSAGLITGLPDNYGRGRIIGDYRRIALYGIDILKEEKAKDLEQVTDLSREENIRLREELAEQIRALDLIKDMANGYGFDISKPARTAKEAFQWLYFGYLAAIKENNGAAMSFGRTATFLDIYLERDFRENTLTEAQAQELVDQLVTKLRLVRHLRTPGYDEIFAGDPTWVTESIGGMLDTGKSLVTKTSFRYLHTLINLGSSPEPNLTVLWSEMLPENFKKYCAQISIKTDAIQYENDDLMRPEFGNDYAIACCVSAMKIGRQMQFFGARCNLAKTLLYAINGGYDEISGNLVVEGLQKVETDGALDYQAVKNKYFAAMEKIAAIYIDAMNIIHYMHDKYAYERSQMALHDTQVEHLMAFGMAGLSVAADSLSAIKYAKVMPVRGENGLVVDFITEGEYPCYGNDDDRVDRIAVEIVDKFYAELRKHPLYKNARHTLSALTITSNVMYGKKTGTTPDGRKQGEPFAPGANPMHGRDRSGALASLNSVAKIPYSRSCMDGVSNTFSILPKALGKTLEEQIQNLDDVLDGYFAQGAHHLNVNVLNREMLIDAMDHPEKYPTLTIRVSGYAVNFNKLSQAHKLEVISRTFHEQL